MGDTYIIKGKPYRNSNEEGKLTIFRGGHLRKGKWMVQVQRGIEPPVWTVGFDSYCCNGLIYLSPWEKNKWLFFREDTRELVYKRPSYTTMDGMPRRASKREKILEAVMYEQELVRILRPRLTPLNVYALPMSGVHSGGTDIVITREVEEDLSDPLAVVGRSLYQISVIGVHRNYSLDFRPSFHEWYYKCKVPIISWTINRWTDSEKHWFIFLEPISYQAIFINKEGLPKKRETSLNFLIPYRIDIEALTDIIKHRSLVGNAGVLTNEM
jgi:hypothetical protein